MAKDIQKTAPKGAGIAFPGGTCYSGSRREGCALEVRVLQYFLTVAQEESVTRAAVSGMAAIYDK